MLKKYIYYTIYSGFWVVKPAMISVDGVVLFDFLVCNCLLPLHDDQIVGELQNETPDFNGVYS